MVTPLLNAETEGEIGQLTKEIARTWCGGEATGMIRISVLFEFQLMSCCTWWDVCQTCRYLGSNIGIWEKSRKLFECHLHSRDLRTFVRIWHHQKIKYRGKTKVNQKKNPGDTSGESTWSRCASLPSTRYKAGNCHADLPIEWNLLYQWTKESYSCLLNTAERSSLIMKKASAECDVRSGFMTKLEPDLEMKTLDCIWNWRAPWVWDKNRIWKQLLRLWQELEWTSRSGKTSSGSGAASCQWQRLERPLGLW